MMRRKRPIIVSVPGSVNVTIGRAIAAAKSVKAARSRALVKSNARQKYLGHFGS